MKADASSVNPSGGRSASPPSLPAQRAKAQNRSKIDEAEPPPISIMNDLATMPDLPAGVSSDRLMWMTIERSTTGIAIVDLDGRWLRVNPALCAITGYSEDELLNLRFQDITHQEDLTEELSNVMPLVAGRTREYVMDKRIVRPGGETAWVRASVALMEAHDESDAYLLAHIEDIDRIRQAAEVANSILAVTGHELRTPLTAIVGYADILHERWDKLPEETRAEALSVIASEARQLTTVVSDVLTLCELRRGQLSVRLTRVELRDIVAAVSESWPGVRVNLLTSPSDRLWADAERVQVVVFKLIENAHKFGDPPILLRISSNGSAVTFSVEDCGSGVPVEFESHLFEGFTQADASSTRSIGGLGTGLAVVEGLVAAMGGQAWYEPATPNGARFMFRLPLC